MVSYMQNPFLTITLWRTQSPNEIWFCLISFGTGPNFQVLIYLVGVVTILPNPVQIGKGLALIMELLQAHLGRIETVGVKCCLKSIGECET